MAENFNSLTSCPYSRIWFRVGDNSGGVFPINAALMFGGPLCIHTEEASDLRWTAFPVLGFTNPLCLWDERQIEHCPLGYCPHEGGSIVMGINVKLV